MQKSPEKFLKTTYIMYRKYYVLNFILNYAKILTNNRKGV